MTPSLSARRKEGRATFQRILTYTINALLKNLSPAAARLWRQKRGCYSDQWRGAADEFLVVVTPSKNVAHGLLRT